MDFKCNKKFIIVIIAITISLMIIFLFPGPGPKNYTRHALKLGGTKTFKEIISREYNDANVIIITLQYYKTVYSETAAHTPYKEEYLVKYLLLKPFEIHEAMVAINLETGESEFYKLSQ